MKYRIFYPLFIMLLNSACSGYLDLKPDQKMAVPTTLEHCELLLNDYSAMNTGYPTLGEIAADDYYLNTKDWKSLSNYDEQQTYNWSLAYMTLNTHWQNPYKTVYLSNQVLAILETLDRNMDKDKFQKILGAAHFFRAFAFHQVAAVFTMPYRADTAPSEMGIPLRLKPDLDYKSTRSTLFETYDQIVTDYKNAIRYLPIVESLKGRPAKAAAYAGLARLYLDMQDYERAYAYADSALNLKADLLNYKDLNTSASFPIVRFNKEVLFPAVSIFSSPLNQSLARIDSDLYQSYDNSDYRKAAYFKHNASDAGTYGFKGSYDNSATTPFIGLTTSELYLIRAECAVRKNKVNQALNDLNTLLEHRIDPSFFVAISETNPEKLLATVLRERRKELVFRGRRWSDLRRLNQDERFKTTLTRTIDGEVYTLEPNGLKYAHLIPELVIAESGINQNKR
ncbi:RagB/SusD family nutrient uptake outer membrane protein [Sphingobacterium sp. UT-1RO-CII-1]|uniref:RagB/SusD family nutrient uptake outer membrane protein n=1 Tax=Sphingobacterium sp. UT-1RO-CII-1 TaxID=2995225 RepID=UPI00227D5785|nr:RagB/SusD family nutrient uptake outer membrane protein [Sphingobacterium sp. UT-1RO-CII-1]MCY4779073.1 RagB/SusD family nutrient uptake outer membrane protein [Sphingobacterium sp. UT-1RO-CII-1]